MTDADRLAIALHEAGHVVLGAALGLPAASATADATNGAVAFTIAPRGASARPPGRSRETGVLVALALIAMAQAGGLAVRDRLDRRPAARWRASAPDADLCAPSPADRAAERDAAEALARRGIWPASGLTAAGHLTRAILDRHASITAAVARALYRHGRLDAEALARLTAPAATDAAMLEFAAAAVDLVDSFPLAPSPADATGQPRGQEEPSMKIFERLRPQGETAAAVAEAIDRTAAALAEAEARIADLQGRRGAALLAGGASAEKHEAALREARDDAERLGALRDALADRHAEAERRERRQRLEAMAADAAASAKAAGQRIARDYPKLAGQLAELLAAERDALAAIDRLTAELGQAPAEAAEGIALPATPLSATVQLPRHDSPDLGWAYAPRWWPAAAT